MGFDNNQLLSFNQFAPVIIAIISLSCHKGYSVPIESPFLFEAESETPQFGQETEFVACS